MKYILFYALFFLSLTVSNAQTEIRGLISDRNNLPIESANIVITDSLGNILSFTYAKSNGEYSVAIKTINNRTISISANSLGYELKSILIKLEINKQIYQVNFNLVEKIEQLNEIVLKPNEKIAKEGLVTTFKVSAFKNDSEQTVEDILKNIPGIEVLKDGTIKAHGRYIDKLLIEGEDMFDKNYTVLTKNLDSKVLDAVQILEEFEDNPIFAKVIESDKIAINLVLKTEFKNIWFGNVSGGLGTEDRRRAGSNVGLIRKEIKFFDFNDYNNLGKKASEQLRGAPSSISSNNSFREQTIETNINPIYSIQNYDNSLIPEGQSIFNNSFINALSFVTTINNHLKIRGTGYYADDNQHQLFSSQTTYNIDETPIFYNENSNTAIKNSNVGGELELKYSHGDKSYFRNNFKYDNKPVNTTNNSLFNDNTINQKLGQNEYSFYNHLNHSYLIGNKNILHTYLYFGENKIHQNAILISPVLNQYLSISENSSINHISNDLSSIHGGKLTMLANLGIFKSDIELGYESLKDSRDNFLITPENNNGVDSLQNNLQFFQKKIELKVNSKYELTKKIEISASISFTYIDAMTEITKKNDLLANPRIGLRFKNFKAGYFNFNYKRNYNEPKSNLFLQNYQLTNYQTLIRGQNNIYFARNNFFSFNYGINNELKTKSLSLKMQYISSDGRYSTQNQIGQNIILTTHNFVNNGNLLSSNLDFTSYFKKLGLSTNLKTSQNFSITPIKANTSDFKKLKTYNATYSLTGRTYFNLPLNFDFKLNLIQSISKFNDMKSKTSWKTIDLNATYKISDIWIASLNNNLYITDSNYHFVGIKLNFNPKKSRFTYEFVLNNLTNEKLFSVVEVDEYSTFKSNTQLIPRYIYAWIKYRF